MPNCDQCGLPAILSSLPVKTRDGRRIGNVWVCAQCRGRILVEKELLLVRAVASPRTTPMKGGYGLEADAASGSR